ncbi:MAG: ribosome maturation factor RimM [Saccharofermentanales bacterium]
MSKAADTMLQDRLRIGQITGTHGVRGEMNVLPLTDDARRFSKLKDVYIVDDSGKEILHPRIESVKYAANKVILKLEGLSDMDSALRLKSRFLAVDRADAVRLPKNSYFICDLIGCVVIDAEGLTLGSVTDVLQTGANDVYVVRRDGLKDLLIPAIKAVVREVDLDARRIIVQIPEGLLDL